MKKALKIASYFFTLIFSVAIVYFALSNSNIEESWHLIEGANYWFLLPVLLASAVGNIVRPARWKLLFGDPEMRFSSFFLSLMSAYCVNYGVPRLGEFTRCWTLQRREKKAFAEVAGTVVVERLVDVFSLLIIVLLTVWAQFEKFVVVYHQYLQQPIEQFQNKVDQKPWLLTAVAIVVVLVSVLLYFLGKRILEKIGERATRFFQSFTTGLKSILKLKNKGLFIAYTVIIWLSYFGTSYFVFWGIDGAEDLPLSAGFAVLAFGSIARSIPLSAGSAGLYHAVVVFTLALFGVAVSTSEAIAILIHGIQMLFFIVVGGASLFILSFKGKR